MMNNHIHHVHLFASDINKSTRFYGGCFDGKIVLDMELAGAGNVFMRIGNGRIHFYDQPPRFSGRGSIHHFGIRTDDLEAMVRELESKGVAFTKEITLNRLTPVDPRTGGQGSSLLQEPIA